MAMLASVRARTDAQERVLISLALVHGALLLAWPSIPLIAAAMWWNANTISHNFIHRPFFRRSWANQAFSCYLTLILGFPQSLWRARHLEHHGLGANCRSQRRRPAVSPIEIALLFALWAGMAVLTPHFVVAIYLPGYLVGLGLCGLHGHYEHARGPVSHYGRLYNLLLFNDGYHIEHHAHPALNWRMLPVCHGIDGRTSRYPAPLRWLEFINLEALERLTMRHARLQRFVVDWHERAIRSVLTELPPVHSIGIVGGGLFPRTAIILGRLLPTATLTLIDLSAENLRIARPFLSASVMELNMRLVPNGRCDFDLLVIPLSFIGNRGAIYEQPPARAVLVHDWIWKRRGTSAVISWLLLKRINLVRR